MVRDNEASLIIADKLLIIVRCFAVSFLFVLYCLFIFTQK